jgi:two-component system response regulator CpxR
MSNYQILIIDDDEVLTDMLGEYLSEEGFEIRAENDGLRGLNQALSITYDLIILDVMLPTLNGFEILKRLREQSSTPVLMLTARGDDVDRIVGLEIGADDYLPKPFNTRELVARMRSILRRTDKAIVNNNSDWTIGGLKVNIENWQASYLGQEIVLTTAEFRILEKVFKANGKAVTRNDLTEYALGRPMNDFDRSIDTHVSNLRKKIKDYHIHEISIKGVRGIGYALVKNNLDAREEE